MHITSTFIGIRLGVLLRPRLRLLYFYCLLALHFCSMNELNSPPLFRSEPTGFKAMSPYTCVSSSPSSQYFDSSLQQTYAMNRVRILTAYLPLITALTLISMAFDHLWTIKSTELVMIDS
eukprot:374141_1